jgi:serine protease Do/serine protease DegQ
MVREVQPGSPAHRAGLMAGDVITSVNRKPVGNIAALTAAMNTKAPQMLLHIRRGRGALFVLIE